MKIEIKDLLKCNFISSIESNNKNMLFVKHSMTEDGYNHNLMLYNGEFKKLTTSNKDMMPLFLNDDEVMFVSSRDSKEGYTKFYKININGGESEFLFSVPLAVNKFYKIGDGKYIFSANINLYFSDLYKESEEEYDKKLKEYKELRKREEEITSIAFYSNGTDYNYDDRNHLFLYDNGNLTRIFDDVNSHYSIFEISEKTNKALVVEIGYTNGIRNKKSTLLELDLNDLSINILSKNDVSIHRAFYQNNKVYMFATEMKNHGINENPKIYRIDNNEKNLVIDYDFSIGNTIGTDMRYGSNSAFYNTNDELYFLSTRGYYCNIYKFSDEKIEEVTNIKGSVDGFAFINNKLIILAFLDGKVQEFYEYETLKQISNLNDYINKETKIYTPEKFVFESNGDILDGFVIKPKDYDENKKYPCILDIHGGPKTVYSDIYYHEMQVFAEEGYFVIYTNPHGGDGRGNKFLDIFGKYGEIDYEDLMNFVDVCLEKYPNIDKDRIGVTGGSYGGFMSNWIVSHTDRFKACVTQRSISNWVSFYGVSDIGYYFATDQNRAFIDEKDYFDKMWNHSPLKYVDNVKTPTLVIHSDKDYRCPLEQGLQWFTALKHRNVDTKMMLYHNETHELSRSGSPKSRISRLDNIVKWMNLYLKKL